MTGGFCYPFSHTMSQFEKPVGHIPVPLTIFGFVSLFLGVATELMGVFRGLNERLLEACVSGGLEFRSEMGLPGTVGILVTAAAAFGIIAAILGTPGTGRRFALGFSALVLVIALFPAFAVWGIFWKPFGVLISVIWGWMSAMIYANSHRMICEGGDVE